MKETSYKNVHRQITNLISLIELCLPFTEELNKTKTRLNFLPSKLEYLKRQAEYLNEKISYSVNTKDSISIYYSDRVAEAKPHRDSISNGYNWKIEDAELELDFLVTNLEDTLNYLERLKKQIEDLVVLKERVEALQEERLVGITPERIYKLMEKQRLENSLALNNRSSAERNYFARIKHKIADYKYSKSIAKTTAIAAGVVLCFSLGSYSSIRYQINENNTVKTEQPTKTPTDI